MQRARIVTINNNYKIEFNKFPPGEYNHYYSFTFSS